MSSSLITILTPTFATAILALTIDSKVNKYFEDCLLGFRFLKEHSALMKLILFFTFINLIAFIGGRGITTTVTSVILARTNQNEIIL